jgi:hypothetical protein
LERIVPRSIDEETDMATRAQQAENVVRSYLESILNPTYVSPEIEKLERQLQDETDVIQIAVLKQALIDEREGTSLEDAFVEHAKSWADSTNVGVKALSEMGVGAKVLSRAGFDVRELDTKTKRATTRTTERAARRSRVTSQDVERSIRAHASGTMLSVSDLVDKTGASNATVTKTLKGLVADAVKEPVDDPDHSGRGRAAKLYERV